MAFADSSSARSSASSSPAASDPCTASRSTVVAAASFSSVSAISLLLLSPLQTSRGQWPHVKVRLYLREPPFFAAPFFAPAFFAAPPFLEPPTPPPFFDEPLAPPFAAPAFLEAPPFFDAPAFFAPPDFDAPDLAALFFPAADCAAFFADVLAAPFFAAFAGFFAVPFFAAPPPCFALRRSTISCARSSTCRMRSATFSGSPGSDAPRKPSTGAPSGVGCVCSSYAPLLCSTSYSFNEPPPILY